MLEKLKEGQKSRTPQKRQRTSEEAEEEGEGPSKKNKNNKNALVQEEDQRDFETKMQDLVERKRRRRSSSNASQSPSSAGVWKTCLSGTPTKGKWTTAENNILMTAIQSFCAVLICP